MNALSNVSMRAIPDDWTNANSANTYCVVLSASFWCGSVRLGFEPGLF